MDTDGATTSSTTTAADAMGGKKDTSSVDFPKQHTGVSSNIETTSVGSNGSSVTVRSRTVASSNDIPKQLPAEIKNEGLAYKTWDKMVKVRSGIAFVCVLPSFFLFAVGLVVACWGMSFGDQLLICCIGSMIACYCCWKSIPRFASRLLVSNISGHDLNKEARHPPM